MPQAVSQHSVTASANVSCETATKPSRRAILKGAPSAALAGASLVPALAMAEAARPSPDAELLALVSKIEAARGVVEEKCEIYNEFFTLNEQNPKDKGVLEAYEKAEKEYYKASFKRADLVLELAGISARTLEGIKAKASCMDEENIERHCEFLECAVSIFADIQALIA